MLNSLNPPWPLAVLEKLKIWPFVGPESYWSIIYLGEYEYNMFPTKLVDLVEEKIEEGIRHDGIEKHPGLRTPMELKLAASTAREYFENDKFWPFLLKEMDYIGSFFG